jgi:hypothetical protein
MSAGGLAAIVAAEPQQAAAHRRQRAPARQKRASGRLAGRQWAMVASARRPSTGGYLS